MFGLLTHSKDFQGQKKAELFTSFSLAGFGVSSSSLHRLSFSFSSDAENLCIVGCATGRLHSARYLPDALVGVTGYIYHFCGCGATVAFLQKGPGSVAASFKRFERNGD